MNTNLQPQPSSSGNLLPHTCPVPRLTSSKPAKAEHAAVSMLVGRQECLDNTFTPPRGSLGEPCACLTSCLVMQMYLVQCVPPHQASLSITHTGYLCWSRQDLHRAHAWASSHPQTPVPSCLLNMSLGLQSPQTQHKGKLGVNNELLMNHPQHCTL